METPRVLYPASHSRQTQPPINIAPNAWPNTNMAYTDRGNNFSTRQNPHPRRHLGPFPGVAPWPRPFLPNNWPTPTPMNLVPNAWPTNMAYTDHGNGVPTKQNRHPSNLVGPFPGEAPRSRPFLPNNWPTPPPINISAEQNPSAVNPVGTIPGIAPCPLPSSSNTWKTPLTMNVRPNKRANNNMPDMDQGFWIPAEQNPFPHNYIGSGPMQVQQLSPYPTGL